MEETDNNESNFVVKKKEDEVDEERVGSLDEKRDEKQDEGNEDDDDDSRDIGEERRVERREDEGNKKLEDHREEKDPFQEKDHHEEHKDNNEDDTIDIDFSKVKAWHVIAGIFALALIIPLFTGGYGGGITGNVVGEQDAGSEPIPNQPTQPAGSEIDMADLIDDDAFKGDENAPVTIVEFSDYECPFCGRHFQQTYSQLISEYVDTGKVKLVYRDFPLSNIHPNAQKAAEAAECAGEQDKYWEMHDKLFNNQQALSVNDLKQYAEDLGLDTDEFNNCLDSGEMALEVQDDLLDGQAAGVQGTPGFIINGQLLSGAQPFSAFKQIIDAELA